MLTKTPLLAVGCVLLASLLGAIAPFFFEHGAKQHEQITFYRHIFLKSMAFT